MKGFSAAPNDLGYTAIRVHYSADPTKDPSTPPGAAWFERARRLFPDPNRWDQEMEINWWIAAGVRVFPEFSESRHARPTTVRDRKVIYRAWDYGYYAPVCLIAQIDTRDRLLLHREMIGREETTRQFAERVIERCAAWYPRQASGYEDFCDPAGQQVTAGSERSEVRDVEILNTLSIFPRWEYGWSRKDGRALIHQLLALRTDEEPGLYINPEGCPTLCQAFLGKYVFPEKRGGTVADEPDDRGNHPWADVMAALRYLVIGLYSLLGLRRGGRPPDPPPPPTFHGYGTPRGPRAQPSILTQEIHP